MFPGFMLCDDSFSFTEVSREEYSLSEGRLNMQLAFLIIVFANNTLNRHHCHRTPIHGSTTVRLVLLLRK